MTEGEDPATAPTWAELGEVQLYFNHDDDASTLPVAYDTFTKMIESFRSYFRFGKGPDGELIVTTKRTGDVDVAVNTRPPPTRISSQAASMIPSCFPRAPQAPAKRQRQIAVASLGGTTQTAKRGSPLPA